LNSAEIRSRWLSFFESNNSLDLKHTVVPSASLIADDPNLLLVNAGMVPFKPFFLGEVNPPYKRATSVQKCVRTLDIDEVGKTTRHASFFQMCGNFSFGDYFKEGAISLAWELLTKSISDGGYGFAEDKLWVTVYQDDDWKKIANLADERIIRISRNDNFWSMGETGPCGPCSEIFYDHGDKIFGGLPGTKDADGDRYIEIWNLVFMQFEQINKDTRIELPKKSVDTGMGLERMAAVIQGVHDNYDIDLFQEIIGYTESLLKVKAKGEELFSYRVIADHLRSSAFLLADGVMPSNEGRGYVLRRIMRR